MQPSWFGLHQALDSEARPQSPLPQKPSPAVESSHPSESLSSVLLSPVALLNWSGIAGALSPSDGTNRSPSPAPARKAIKEAAAKKKASTWSYRMGPADSENCPPLNVTRTRLPPAARKAMTPKASTERAPADATVGHCGLAGLISEQPPWVQQTLRVLLCLELPR